MNAKKILKKTIATIILNIMILSQIPINAYATESNKIDIAKDNIIIGNQYTEEDNSTEEYEEGQVIVKTKNPIEENDELLANSTVEDTITLKNDETISLINSDEYSTEELIEQLDGEVLSVEPNYTIHIASDTYSDYQWAIENNGQNSGVVGNDINPFTTNSKDEKVIVVMDTGVDYTHEDLKNVMWNNNNQVSGLGTYGYDYIEKDDDPQDEKGHGTHCAGIIAAESNNDTGITGAIQDSNIKIMALKVLDSKGEGTSWAILSAYQDVIKAQESGVNIIAINNSWGYTQTDTSSIVSNELKYYIDLVGKNGALSICAAGNSGSNNDNTKFIPACIDSDYIISVAATNELDELTYFSNYGASTVDIAAPGTNILSTVSYNVFNPSIYTNTQIKNLCSTYYDFASTNLTNYFVVDSEVSEQVGTVEQSSESYFGAKNKYSLKCTIPNAVEGEKYYVMLPFSVTETGEYYYSIMYSYASDKNTWNHSFKNDTIEETGSKYFLVPIVARTSGTCVIYIDDFAISTVNANEKDFGKYEFMNGTSMATPYVTAAVGMMSNNYSQASDLEIKNKVLSSVRKTDNLKSKVSTGGTLDLSQYKEETTKEDSTVLVKGVSLSKTSLSLSAYSTTTLSAKVSNSNATNKTIKWTSSNTNYATVDQNGKVTPKSAGAGKTVTITAKATDGSNKSATCKITITKPKVTNLKVLSQTASSIKIQWDKVSGANKYEVYLYTNGNYKKIATTSANAGTISKLKTGTTYKVKIRAYKTLDKNCYTDYAYVTSSTKTAAPKISKLTSTKKKTLTVKWNKVSQATGYEIYVATSKNGKYTKKATITKASTISKTITGLKSKKKYYVKIRTYRVVDNKKIYSNYSSIYSVKTK